MLDLVFNFLKENWGDTASAFGLGFAILFSLQAKTAAQAAKDAANEARSRIIHVDYYGETQRMIALTDELSNLLSERKWERASDRASTLRYGCFVLANMQETNIPEELLGKVKRLPTQLRDLVNAIDKVLDPERDNPDVARYRRILATGRETLSLLEYELKLGLGEKK